MIPTDYPKSLRLGFPALLAVTVLMIFGSVPAEASKGSGSRLGFATIKGTVRDASDRPIAGALISIFKSGSLKLLRQIKATVDGSFSVKVVPGSYTILAVASGFNSASLSSVEVARSAEFYHRFNLQPAGLGKTTPERKTNRGSSMWSIRSAQIRRSIYQYGETPESPSTGDGSDDFDSHPGLAGFRGRPQTVLESFVSSSRGGDSSGVNFASLHPLTDKADMVVSGQFGAGRLSPKRLEGVFRLRAAQDHQLRVMAAASQIPVTGLDSGSIGQLSFQISDEWRVRDRLVLVLGLDYSRFMDTSGDSVLSPRFGLQFDADSKTRFRAAFTAVTDTRNPQSVIELEGLQVFFAEPATLDDTVSQDGKAVMNRSRRFEFGVERLLDRRSSFEANVFADATVNRGVGLANMPVDFLGEDDDHFLADQQGKAVGVRVVYSRRLDGRFSTSAGYAIGNGQRISAEPPAGPSDLFENDVFQTFFGQFGADLRSGTNVRTVFRLSSRAAVFAIDPFRGRLMVFDPGVSVTVTQSLPNMGLPIRAEATLDARNLLDHEAGAKGDESGVALASQRRTLRGGIKVRF